MKAELNREFVYTQYDVLTGKEEYKILWTFVTIQLDTILCFKLCHPPEKVYTSINVIDQHNIPQQSLQFILPSTQETEYHYYVSNIYCNVFYFLWLKLIHTKAKPIFKRGWIQLQQQHSQQQLCLISPPKHSNILFFNNVYYRYIRFFPVAQHQELSLHYCSQFFYSFHSNYFQEYDENQQEFIYKQIPLSIQVDLHNQCNMCNNITFD